MVGNPLIRSPIIASFFTSALAFVCTLGILTPQAWPHFSWVMRGVPFFQGVAEGIAPYLAAGCDGLADARGAASMLMLGFGTAAFAAAMVSLIGAGRSSAKPVDALDGVDITLRTLKGRTWPDTIRAYAFTFSLFASFSALGYFWVFGPGLGASVGLMPLESDVGACPETSPVAQVGIICGFGFMVLAPLLVALKQIYRIIHCVTRSA